MTAACKPLVYVAGPITGDPWGCVRRATHAAAMPAATTQQGDNDDRPRPQHHRRRPDQVRSLHGRMGLSCRGALPRMSLRRWQLRPSRRTHAVAARDFGTGNPTATSEDDQR